jgi:hypothetical protein
MHIQLQFLIRERRWLAVGGFLDGTVRKICRPGEFQESVYNGHKKSTALKYQAVTAPDGLKVSLAGPFGGRSHDNEMLRQSGLLKSLASLDYGVNEGHFFMYGDAGYVLSRYC